MNKKFIILDRDETLNHDPGYIHDPKDFILKEETIPALALLSRFGYKFVIATNQAGVAKKKITPEQLFSIHQKLLQELKNSGISIEKIYVCPHSDEDNCMCRKPKTGMIDQILQDFQVNPQDCVLVGDRYRDIFPGEKYNIPGIIVYNSANHGTPPTNLLYKAKNLKDACDFLLEREFEITLAQKIFKNKADTSLLKKLQEFREQKKKIVFTNGCFDILHTGHLQYLMMAKNLGDELIIGINSDESVTALKGPTRPVNNQLDRQQALASLFFTSAIVVFQESTPIELIEVIRPDIHVKGGDYREEDLPETKIIKRHGGEVVILPFRKGYSTTQMIEKIHRNSK